MRWSCSCSPGSRPGPAPARDTSQMWAAAQLVCLDLSHFSLLSNDSFHHVRRARLSLPPLWRQGPLFNVLSLGAGGRQPRSPAFSRLPSLHLFTLYTRRIWVFTTYAPSTSLLHLMPPGFYATDQLARHWICRLRISSLP